MFPEFNLPVRKKIITASCDRRRYFTAISCQDAKITAAEITGVSVKQTDSLTYNGRPQVADVEVRATTVNGNPVSFVYGVTAEQAADPNKAS